MKYCIVILLLFSFSVFAQEIVHIQSDKLTITGDGLEVPHYDDLYNEPVNPITIRFDINNIKSIIIIDQNAKNGKCGKFQKEKLFFLIFDDPGKNHRQVSTLIDGPCLIGTKLKLLLVVKTAEGIYYKNIIEANVRPLYLHSEYE